MAEILLIKIINSFTLILMSLQNAVGDNDYLKEQLVEQLMCYNELNEAVKWSRVFCLSDESIPEVVAVKRRIMDQ